MALQDHSWCQSNIIYVAPNPKFLVPALAYKFYLSDSQKCPIIVLLALYVGKFSLVQIFKYLAKKPAE